MTIVKTPTTSIHVGYLSSHAVSCEASSGSPHNCARETTIDSSAIKNKDIRQMLLIAFFLIALVGNSKVRQQVYDA